MNVGILNYDAGNIYSVYNLIYNLGFTPKIISNKNEFKNIDKLIIPGVGSAYRCIENLKKNKLFDLLSDNLNSELPILGICLGLQIFCENLYENGEANGLKFIKAKVQKISQHNKYNIGWSKVEFKSDDLNSIFINNKDFYFCHSFSIQELDKKDQKFLEGHIKFDQKVIPSVIKKKNFLGVQFHPEKSQTNGVKFMKYFLNI